MELSAKINRAVETNTTETPEGCRLFTGASNNGYGMIRHGGMTLPLHRVIWEEINGKVPAGKRLVSGCKKRNCIAASHWGLAKGKQYEKKEQMVTVTWDSCMRSGLWWMKQYFDAAGKQELSYTEAVWDQMKHAHRFDK